MGAGEEAGEFVVLLECDVTVLGLARLLLRLPLPLLLLLLLPLETGMRSRGGTTAATRRDDPRRVVVRNVPVDEKEGDDDEDAEAEACDEPPLRERVDDV